LRIAPQAGIAVGSQTIDWYRGKHYLPDAYANYFLGAYQIFKECNYDAEPFLDYQLTDAAIKKYRLVYIPNAPCLSDAQCATLAKYVEDGGTLVATHLTSVADEHGRVRNNYGLTDLLGVSLADPEPFEAPELYLRLASSRDILPQDLQITLFKAAPGATVLAETYDRGHDRILGPAVTVRSQGKGKAIYIGSGLEAVYQETRMEPVRNYLSSLFDPILRDFRTYEVEHRPGLTPHYLESEDDRVLHLLANTGNKWKKTNVREQYLPIENVRTRIRIPEGRKVRWHSTPPSTSSSGTGPTNVARVNPERRRRAANPGGSTWAGGS
jgi:hypothetical protein